MIGIRLSQIWHFELVRENHHPESPNKLIIESRAQAVYPARVNPQQSVYPTYINRLHSVQNLE